MEVEDRDSLEYHSAEEAQVGQIGAETSNDSIEVDDSNTNVVDSIAEKHELITFDSILSSARVDNEEGEDERSQGSDVEGQPFTSALDRPVVTSVGDEDLSVEKSPEIEENLQQRVKILEKENYLLKQLISRVAQRLQVDVDDLYEPSPQTRHFEHITDNLLAVIDHLQHSLEKDENMLEDETNEEEASDLPSQLYNKASFPHKDRGFSISSQRTTGSKADLMSLEWLECVDVHPPPPFDFNSPVVDHVFQTWTEDIHKINYLKSWVNSLRLPATDAYPIGIQITSVSNILRDAFVVLIIPLMRVKSIDPLVIYIREYKIEQEQNTSRQLSTSSDHIAAEDAESRAPAPEVVNSDPFVKSHDIVYDIRIKRIAELRHHASSSLSQHVQFRDINKHEALSSQSAYRVDSKDYSSLSEINMIFKEIDKNPGALDPASTNSLSTESENPKQEVNEAPSSSDVQDVVAPSPIPTGKMDKVEIPTPVQSSDKVVATEGDAAVASSPQNGAFFPASITSWFYGTSINDASKTSNTPPRSVKSTTSDVIETGSISSEPSTISESKSNSANKRAPDKIAARLEALRKKNLK